MLRLVLYKPQGCTDFWKPKPCHVGIHWVAFAKYSQMVDHVSGFQSFFSFLLHHFVLAKLATSRIRVNLCTVGACNFLTYGIFDDKAILRKYLLESFPLLDSQALLRYCLNMSIYLLLRSVVRLCVQSICKRGIHELPGI